jgi:hypothetical protein
MNLELHNVSVTNVLVVGGRGGDQDDAARMSVLSHLQVKWEDGLIVLVQGESSLPMLWMGRQDDAGVGTGAVVMDVKLRGKAHETQASGCTVPHPLLQESSGPKGSPLLEARGSTNQTSLPAEVGPEVTSPFKARHTADDSGGESLLTKDETEQTQFEHYTRDHSEIDLEINAPALRGHFSSKEFQALYSLLIDLSAYEPWAQPPQRDHLMTPTMAELAAESEESDNGSDDVDSDDALDSESRAHGGQSAPKKPNFISVTVKAGQVVVTLDETDDVGDHPQSEQFLEIRGQELNIFACAQHLGTKDVVVAVRIADLELQEKTPDDREVVRVLDRCVLHKAAFRESPLDQSPSMLNVALRISVTPTGVKQTQTAVMATRVRAHHRVVPSGKNWLFRLIDWMDEGMIDPVWEGFVAPMRLNKVHLHLFDTMIDYALPSKPLQTAIFVQHVKLMLNIIPNAPGLTVPLTFSHLQAFVRQSAPELARQIDPAVFDCGNGNRASDWPLKRGFVEFLAENRLGLVIRKAIAETEPKLAINVDNLEARITTRCDSFLALVDLIVGYLDDKGIPWPVAEEGGGGGGRGRCSDGVGCQARLRFDHP